MIWWGDGYTGAKRRRRYTAAARRNAALIRGESSRGVPAQIRIPASEVRAAAEGENVGQLTRERHSRLVTATSISWSPFRSSSTSVEALDAKAITRPSAQRAGSN